jgi:hypothetical protein
VGTLLCHNRHVHIPAVALCLLCLSS